MMLSFANTPRFKGVLSDWNVARVYNMKGTFQQAVSFNSDLSKWDLSSAKDISGMVSEAIECCYNEDV